MNAVTSRVEQQGNVAVIHLAGYLSSESAGPLEEAFQQVAGSQKVLLVFQEKDFINSAGLAVLFDLILPAQEQGKQVRVVHPARQRHRWAEQQLRCHATSRPCKRSVYWVRRYQETRRMAVRLSADCGGLEPDCSLRIASSRSATCRAEAPVRRRA